MAYELELLNNPDPHLHGLSHSLHDALSHSYCSSKTPPASCQPTIARKRPPRLSQTTGSGVTCPKSTPCILAPSPPACIIALAAEQITTAIIISALTCVWRLVTCMQMCWALWRRPVYRTPPTSAPLTSEPRSSCSNDGPSRPSPRVLSQQTVSVYYYY